MSTVSSPTQLDYAGERSEESEASKAEFKIDGCKQNARDVNKMCDLNTLCFSFKNVQE